MAEKNRKSSSQQSGVSPRLKRDGGLSYLEIPAVDARRSAAFYAYVLGWVVEGADTDQPKFQDCTGHMIGRWKTGLAISREPGLMPYIYVDHIEAVIKRITENGGSIVKPPYAEGNLQVATFRDPSGNLIGVWEEGRD